MNKSEKLKLLQKLSEKELTQKFLIPLYESKGMGCKNVRYTHRKLEFGKDIIYSKENEYGIQIYTGVQVKRTKITTSDIDTILRQITEAFGEPFTNLSDGKKKDLDRVVVLSSNEILEEAKDSLWASLKGARLDKLINFIDGNQLVELLDNHLPSAFWEEYDYFNKYFEAMKNDFETIKDISAIGQKEPIPLEDIYISMRVSEKTREREIPIEKGRKIFDDKLIKKGNETERPIERANIIDVERAVKEYRKLVIVGAPGSGKTTLLKHLALKSCKENLKKQERICVPIPIILLKLLESGKSLRGYIDVVFEEYDFPKAKEFVEKDLKEGKCIILLDGFDELVSRENQEQITLQIQEFVKQYHRTQIIVTSRIAGYNDELKDFTKLELMEFDDKQIKTFIENWFGKTEPDKTKSMLEAIKSEYIKAIVRNPLMITITAIIYEEDKKLPQKRADLYKRCVEVLLSKWDVQKKLKNVYAPDKKEFILRKLAFYGHSNNKRIMTEEEIIEEMLRHFPRTQLGREDAKPFLNEIWQRSYLLRQVSMGSYDFLHLSFQEYFTALELKEQDDGISTIIKYLPEPWWEEPILLYAGLKNDATNLIERMKKEVPEDIFYSNLMFFGKCIADADRTEPSLREEIVNNLWLLYRTTKFSPLREKAISILSIIKPDELIDLLIKELENKESAVRLEASYILGKIGNEKAVKSLFNLLATDGDKEVQWRVATLIGEIGSETAVKQLTMAFSVIKSSLIRGSIVHALGITKNEEAIDLLIKTINQGKDDDVSGMVVDTLGITGSEKAIEPLIQALTTDKKGDVRARSADALGRIGSEKAIEPLIQALTTDKEGGVRAMVADALGRIGSEKAIESLIKTLVTDKESYVRWRAADALGRIGSEKAIEPLIQALTTDKEGGVRASATDALGRIGSERALKVLIDIFSNDKEGNVRGRAIEALGIIGGDKEIELIINALTTDKEDWVRASAADALGKIGSEKAIESLIKTLVTDKESYVRWRAADALGIIGSKVAIEPLIEVLTNDKVFFLRWSAANALEKLGNEKAIGALILALKDEGEWYGCKVKDAAFNSLEKISKRIRKRITLETV
ncbi:MAG: HEAT repeat domain-containing protein [Planctomycetes bacterium]|nr:HEAT repeat domain-containing protein [Planctomycetota bacterium]